MIRRQRNLTVRGGSRQSNNERRAPKYFWTKRNFRKTEKMD